MPQCIVIADDLTGANATGVLLKKMNYSAFTVMNADRLKLTNLTKCDCLLYPTDSRGVTPDIAYNRVFNVTQLLKDESVKIYSKRIDSTLRGNLGAETDAILDALGPDYTAIVAPCFPASGRSLVGGYLLVNGMPLHKTEAAFDPIAPVTTSDAASLFRQQSKYSVSSLSLNDLAQGQAHLCRQLKNKKQNSRILICDCITQEDLDLLADAVIDSCGKFICIDPGVFTATVTRKQIVPYTKAAEHKILTVVGSVNAVTRMQMEELWLAQQTHNVFVKIKELIKSEAEQEAEITRVVTEILENTSTASVSCVTGDGLYPHNQLDIPEYAGKLNCSTKDIISRINQSFSEITYRILKADSSFRGLYTSGGDITVAVCDRFQTAGLWLADEVLPLAAYGTFHKGAFDHLHLITKGGMVGDNNAVNKCVQYLKEKLFI